MPSWRIKAGIVSHVLSQYTTLMIIWSHSLRQGLIIIIITLFVSEGKTQNDDVAELVMQVTKDTLGRRRTAGCGFR